MASHAPKIASALYIKKYINTYHPDFNIDARPFLYKSALERGIKKGIVRQVYLVHKLRGKKTNLCEFYVVPESNKAPLLPVCMSVRLFVTLLFEVFAFTCTLQLPWNTSHSISA